MGQQEYLAALRRLLRTRLTKKETEIIVADYREYFESGLADGKSEEALCLEFGTPESTAQELFLQRQADTPQTGVPRIPGAPAPLRARVSFWAAVVMCFLLYMAFAWPLNSSPTHAVALSILLLTLILGFGFAERRNLLPAWTCSPAIYRIVSTQFYLTELSLTAAICLIFLQTDLRFSNEGLLTQAATFMCIGYRIFFILFFLSFVWNLLFHKNRIFLFGNLFFSFGVFFTALLLERQMQNISTLHITMETITGTYGAPFFPILLGIAGFLALAPLGKRWGARKLAT